MNFALARNWWSLVIRGIVGILLGIVAFTRPGITIGALVLLFGAYALIDGVVSFAGAVRAAGIQERWGVLLFEGVVGILAGVAAFVWPAITALVLVYIIAFWAIIHGIAEIAAAVRLRKYISGEWLFGLAGVVSILFGVIMAASPMLGALMIAVWFGVFAFIFGVIMLTLGFKLRHWHHGLPGSSMPLPVH
jgi:uncharacterized membrane protein HdeD (DUF308 family)